MNQWIKERKLRKLGKIFPNLTSLDKIYYNISQKGFSIIISLEKLDTKQIKSIDKIDLRISEIFNHKDGTIEILLKPKNSLSKWLIVIGFSILIFNLFL